MFIFMFLFLFKDLINKKAITPVIALSLLLAVSVISVITFSDWFSLFSSKIIIDYELESKYDKSNLEIIYFNNNELFIKNSESINIEVYKVNINGNDCFFSGNYSSDLNLDLTLCLNEIESDIMNIEVYTNFGILSKTMYLENYIDYNMFISEWDTSLNSSSSSNSYQVELPLESTGSYNFTVSWGDGVVENIVSYNQVEVVHTYTVPGVYTVQIYGNIEGFRFNDVGDKLKLLDIKNWGDLNVGDNGGYFRGCSNLVLSATDNLNLTGTTSLYNMFNGASSLTGDLSGWNTSNVENMRNMFSGTDFFTSDLNYWDTSSVTNMNSMFSSALTFDGNISGWNTSTVTNMETMFYGASSFNQPLNDWDVSKVTDFGTSIYNGMFYNADSFNQNLSSWKLNSSITYLGAMFRNTNSFNGDLSSWDVSNIENMRAMFQGANSFNQSLNYWNVSLVTNMRDMFSGATFFNQDLEKWDVSKVSNMEKMFAGTNFFNGNISKWNVSSVSNMYQMFSNADSINQSLFWDTSSVTNMGYMFSYQQSFDQNISFWNVSSVTACSGFSASALSYWTSDEKPNFTSC
jgi:surface protein